MPAGMGTRGLLRSPFFMPDSSERSPTKTINDTWYRNFAQLMYLDLQIFHFLVLDVDFMLIAVTNSIDGEILVFKILTKI